MKFALALLLRPFIAVAFFAVVYLCMWGLSKLIPEGEIKRQLFKRR